MNTEQQLKALQQILETLNIAASRQTDVDFKKDGNKHFTTAIQNTKKLIKDLEYQINSDKEAQDFHDWCFQGMDSLGLSNIQ